jgi:general secretion pathway protein C
MIAAMTSRRAIILVFVLGVTFLIAHTINAVIAEALFVPSGVAMPRTMDADATAIRSPSALAEQVRMSGLFPLPPDPVAATPGGASGPMGVAQLQPLNLASKLQLIGIVMGDRGGVSAIIEELASKRQLFIRLHDQIPDIGEVTEIQRSGILVRQGNQQEFLPLSNGLSDKPPTAQAVSARPQAAVAGGQIKKVLDRREVEQALNDLPKLLSQARAVPVLANGAMTGFRLDYIAKSSFYEKIGLQYGDVLKQVNGIEIKDPGTMLSLFQQLRNENSVKLDILRNNQRTTMMFDIR